VKHYGIAGPGAPPIGRQQLSIDSFRLSKGAPAPPRFSVKKCWEIPRAKTNFSFFLRWSEHIRGNRTLTKKKMWVGLPLSPNISCSGLIFFAFKSANVGPQNRLTKPKQPTHKYHSKSTRENFGKAQFPRESVCIEPNGLFPGEKNCPN